MHLKKNMVLSASKPTMWAMCERHARMSRCVKQASVETGAERVKLASLLTHSHGFAARSCQNREPARKLENSLYCELGIHCRKS